MSDDRTFRFQKGFTIRVRDDYDPRLYWMAIEAYKEQNPPPEPPLIERQRKVKGGAKVDHVRDYQDADYLEAYSIWKSEMNSQTNDLLYEMAIDPESIDAAFVEAGRQWAEEKGYGATSNDIKLFLRVVPVEPKKGEKISELAKFHTWLYEIGGPSEALVDQFIATFRANVQRQKNLPGVAFAIGQQAEMEAVAVVDVFGG